MRILYTTLFIFLWPIWLALSLIPSMIIGELYEIPVIYPFMEWLVKRTY